jgi:hypothetical protein
MRLRSSSAQTIALTHFSPLGRPENTAGTRFQGPRRVIP